MNNHTRILYWSEEDRPREKLLQKGKHVLTNAELIAILLGSGTRNLSAVDLARQILSHVDNNLNELARLSVSDLVKLKGVGKAKAISIISAMELGRRRQSEKSALPEPLNSPDKIYDHMSRYLLDLDHEQFWVVLLSQACRPIRETLISKGGLSATLVDPRIIFRHALEAPASAIILVHNHPSGTLRPSQQDIDITKKIAEGGKILSIPVYDHIIFTNDGYFSFSEEALL